MNSNFFVDGACSSNGYANSSGGFGVVEIDKTVNKKVWEYQEFKSPTTNNEMELMAILTAIKRIVNNSSPTFIGPIIYTDSAYCYNIINKWMYDWERNGWVRGRGESIKNLDIIREIYNYLIKYNQYNIKVEKVKGHSNIFWNEYADQLATGKIKI